MISVVRTKANGVFTVRETTQCVEVKINTKAEDLLKRPNTSLSDDPLNVGHSKWAYSRPIAVWYLQRMQPRLFGEGKERGENHQQNKREACISHVLE